MHEREHLLIVGPAILLNSVKTQSLRRAPAALIQRRDEPGSGLNFVQLFVVNGDRFHDVSFISRSNYSAKLKRENETEKHFFCPVAQPSLAVGPTRILQKPR
jgi:hypothetical protein